MTKFNFFIQTLPLTGALVCATFSPIAQADNVFIWAEEVGVDVIFHHQGSIDLTGFPTPSTNSATAAISPAEGGYLSAANFDTYTPAVPDPMTRTFGGGSLINPNSVTGDFFVVAALNLGVPENYISKSPISGSMTFLGTDLATLGVDTTPFSFNTTVGTNTIHMFTTPDEFAAAEAAKAAATASARADLERKIRKLKKKARKLKKKGQKAKAKKLLKKLKRQLAGL